MSYCYSGLMGIYYAYYHIILRYEVYYYNASKKKFVLDKIITKNTSNSYTKSNLAIGKNHYLKVRSYKIVESKKYYSAFSEKDWIRM